MQNVAQTTASQYATAAVLTALINSMNAAIDPHPLFEDALNQILDPDTAALSASNYGLDRIGRIVGVNRVIQIAGTQTYFGFQSASGTYSGLPYGQAPFYIAGNGTTQNYALSNAAYLQLINAKMLANISNNSVPAINNILMVLFCTPITITGNAFGGTLFVDTVANGTLAVGQTISGPGISGTVTITSPQPINGGPGLYGISSAATIPFGTYTVNGQAYCTDGHNMTMTYTFSFVPNAVQLGIITYGNVLPRPSGVAVSVVHP